jgi:glucose/arabinose dehydrogenase
MPTEDRTAVRSCHLRWMRALAAVMTIAVAWTPGQAATLLPGFVDNPVATVGSPTAMAFTPDGRLLVTTQGGALRVHANGTLLPTAALQIAPANICTSSERGLLGVAVDPTFGFNNYIYLFYTFNSPAGCMNRVSRFTLPGSNAISVASELVLLDNIPSPGGNHNGGDVQFGFDGLLYVSIGDGGCSLTNPGNCAGANDNARHLSQVLGKILRIRADGSIPSANPYVAAMGSRRCANPAGPVAGSGPCQEIFAHGLRNPFRIAFRQGTNDFNINDVGQGNWEEIDRGILGADYGWNLREGPCVNGSYTNCPPPPVGITDPIYAYRQDATGCRSITGGAFVPARRWTADLRDHYLFADFVCGGIFSLGTNLAATSFGSAFGAFTLTALTMGPSSSGRSLYYATYAGGGAIQRIDHVGSVSYAKQDFDGNARSDLIWSRADGSVALWMMNGGTIASSAGFTVTSEWSLVGTGDFNSDGRGDLLFRRSSDGFLVAWLMNGGTIAGTAGFDPGSSFAVAGIADVNGDGVDDLVLRDASGAVVFWILTKGGTVLWPAAYPLAAEWAFAGKGDVNGDGTDDIVWRKADGATAIWFMNGKDIAASASYAVGTEWALRGVGDLDGNGKSDLLWRRTDGTVAFWFMNGATIAGSAGYPQTTAWDIAGTADLNADGRADIVWRNSDGSTAIWLMNGGAIIGAVTYPLGPEWSAAGLQ